jgi:cell envelope opacity-associated protein A
MSDRQNDELSSQNNLKPGLLQSFWHLPDNFHWMSPLPSFHRRWLMVLTLFILILLLLPSPKKTLQEAGNREIPMQAALVIDGYQSFENLTSSPVKIINGEPQTENDEQGTWKMLQVQQGQSFTQLLRENNYPIEDAVALAKAEGDDKPLSNIKAGQQIKLKLDDKNRIVAVDIEMPGQQQAFFIRQPDGKFYRYQ